MLALAALALALLAACGAAQPVPAAPSLSARQTAEWVLYPGTGKPSGMRYLLPTHEPEEHGLRLSLSCSAPDALALTAVRFWRNGSGTSPNEFPWQVSLRRVPAGSNLGAVTLLTGTLAAPKEDGWAEWRFPTPVPFERGYDLLPSITSRGRFAVGPFPDRAVWEGLPVRPAFVGFAWGKGGEVPTGRNGTGGVYLDYVYSGMS